MKSYQLTYLANGAACTTRVRARSLAAAKMILSLQGVHGDSVITWHIIPTRAQVARTQNLMRSI